MNKVHYRANEELVIPRIFLVNYINEGDSRKFSSTDDSQCKVMLVKWAMVKQREEWKMLWGELLKRRRKRRVKTFERCKFNGEGWWHRFVQRHPKLSLHRPGEPWLLFQPVKLEGNNLLDQACYIYGMDETGMLLDHKQPKCIAPKDMKNVYGPSSGNKTQITILACANAVGTALPPMVILKGECLNYEWTKGEIPNAIYGTLPQSWIDHQLIADWLLKLFIKNIPQTHCCCFYMGIYLTVHPKLSRMQQKIILLFLSATKCNLHSSTTWCQLFWTSEKHWSNICHRYIHVWEPRKGCS